jgi:hypothetical protein
LYGKLFNNTITKIYLELVVVAGSNPYAPPIVFSAFWICYVLFKSDDDDSGVFTDVIVGF